MLGPSGVLTGSIRPYCEEFTSRIEKEARSRFIPPGPKTETRRKRSISLNGLVSSRIADNWLERKNSFREAIRGLGFIKFAGWGESSGEIRLIFSLTLRSNRNKPILKALLATSSPTRLNRRLDKWSI